MQKEKHLDKQESELDKKNKKQNTGDRNMARLWKPAPE